MNYLLTIENITTGYRNKPILTDISFGLAESKVLAIVGQNGSGKSTLLKTIARIIKDNTGDIYFAGMNLEKKHPWELKALGISYFLQGGMVFPTLKVKEHFELVLKEKKRNEALTLKDESLSLFPKLYDSWEKRGGNLSGGQKRMLSFAMLISQQTKCWLLDEPTAGLSPSAIKDTVRFLQRVKEERNVSMLLVEHNYSVARELADQIIVIKEGRLFNKYEHDEFIKENFIENILFN